MKTPRVPGLRTMTALIMGAAIIMAAAVAFDRTPETWRGLVVAPEHRCAPYRRSDYPYPPSVEARIVAAQGGRVYGPYTGTHLLRYPRGPTSNTSLPRPRPMTAVSARKARRPAVVLQQTCST